MAQAQGQIRTCPTFHGGPRRGDADVEDVVFPRSRRFRILAATRCLLALVSQQVVWDELYDMAKSMDIAPRTAQEVFERAAKSNGNGKINGHATANGVSNKRVAVLVRGDQVTLKSVRWAWKHRFAFGKLALIAGDPGLGKSQIALDIVARHTTGDYWPVDGGRAQLAEAIVRTAEDGLSDTVAPRLVAAGADMSKVHFLTGTKLKEGDEELFDLTRDVEPLRDVLCKHPSIKVIDIDPLTRLPRRDAGAT
jgi:hypothetical protein